MTDNSATLAYIDLINQPVRPDRPILRSRCLIGCSACGLRQIPERGYSVYLPTRSTFTLPCGPAPSRRRPASCPSSAASGTRQV